VGGLTDMLGGRPIESAKNALGGELIAPIDEQGIWAAGVTYARSRDARTDESREPDAYDRVYSALRPELFLKARGAHVLGPSGVGRIRSDSKWDVPEPEGTVVIRADGTIFGYTIDDDLPSRSIEGENPPYLPQAKVYEGSAVIGPWILPADDVTGPFDIVLDVRRRGSVEYRGTTSTSAMHRSFCDLVDWLTR
jgi:2-dehydro-3-deoxy-D-arabinonate dehydratase